MLRRNLNGTFKIIGGIDIKTDFLTVLLWLQYVGVSRASGGESPLEWRRFGMAALRNGGPSEWRPFGMADPNRCWLCSHKKSEARLEFNGHVTSAIYFLFGAHVYCR